jgi:sigma-B regulation protein RsbU (phosphoserine phosphatase)
MKNGVDVNRLSRLSFLAGIQRDVIERLAADVRECNFQPGEVIISEGSPGREVYIVVEGLVEVVKDGGPQEMVIAQLGPECVFGEMGMLENQPRFATVRAVQPTCLFELTERAIDSIFDEQPMLIYPFARLLSARLRETDYKMVSELRRKTLELDQAYQQLQAAQAGLLHKERMEHELELARQVQLSFMPADFPHLPGYQIAARYQPAYQVGGDFYDVIPLASGRFGLAIADVSDKGMAAALYMALARSLLRVEARRSPSPCVVLIEVNRLLLELGPPDMFITIFYGIVDPVTRCLTYSRAGHNRPLLIRQGETEELGCSGMALGVLESPSFFCSEEQAQLIPGDRLVLYSDGLTDVLSSDQPPFDLERLKLIMESQAGLSPDDLCEAVFTSLADYRAGAEQYDDMTLMVVAVE